MRGFSRSRINRTDLLARPPCVARTYDLLDRGLLSAQEYERHKAKIIEP